MGKDLVVQATNGKGKVYILNKGLGKFKTPNLRILISRKIKRLPVDFSSPRILVPGILCCC